MPFQHFRRLAFVLCLLFVSKPWALAAGLDVLPATRVHTQLTKRGLGHDVKILRVDGSEIKGRIVILREESVDLQTKNSSSVSNVRYAEIAAVKGPGLSTGAKVGIGVGVGILVSTSIVTIVINHELNKPWNF